MKAREDLIRRLKVVSLIVIHDERLSFLNDKIDTAVEAVDIGYPKALDMVRFLEDAIIKCLEV